jgi:hypothetical protein
VEHSRDDLTKSQEVLIMEKIIHPVSGENGYFCSEKQKLVIDAIIDDFNNRNTLLLNEGVSNE